jgi:valyl-tRNA synthetase
MTMIDKTYQPSAIETRIYATWEESGAFRCGRPERIAARPYCIVIPPPNVTGSLHMGHALNNTLQDVLARFERMRGRDVLWQPGMDHAGIATQMVVERQLMERQEPGRRALGRDKFLEKIWAWKAESGGTITAQLKRLGASCDWSRERFTMDEGLSRAVLKVFVDLYREGLIYKDKRLVNWDPKLLTAISDLEVQQVEHRGTFEWTRNGDIPLDLQTLRKALSRDPNGYLYYFDYPISDDSGAVITLATTRPETMLGDRAVAVHPDDERYKHLIGKHVRLPLVSATHPIYSNLIPIIGDEYSDPEKGTGAVKITPAHDFNDFEVAKRHGLAFVNILTPEARIVSPPERDSLNYDLQRGLTEGDLVPERLRGLDRFEARKVIVEMMFDTGLLAKIEPYTHVVPHGDRSGEVIEPYLTEQWYVDARKLAQPALEAVRIGRTVFVPKNWEKTYFDWLENIQPWCVSRQLWWGHQIPVWYGPKRTVSGFEFDEWETFVAESEAEALKAAREYYGHNVRIVRNKAEAFQLWMEAARPPITPIDAMPIWRDEDVLDTWFSSALWPFSTLGWPEQTKELARYYPTDVLVTGFDIIFFWVARMMMMGLHFMQEIPFHTVYIHALVRDERGAKMSKSKGNVIDPLAVIDQYGADALRFTLAAMAAQGRDIKLSAQRVEGYRNFATKLWNACRFAEMNHCASVPGFEPKSAREMLNRWIAHETAKAAREITGAIESYRFNDAAGTAYRFVWNIFCDWYVELGKPVLQGADGAAKNETRAMTAWVRDQSLRLLHPFTPFVTEELWRVTAQAGPARPTLLALADWPRLDTLDDAEAEAELGWLIDLVSAIRSVRTEMNVAQSIELPLVLVTTSATTQARAQRWGETIQRLARISQISLGTTAPQGAVQLIVRGEIAALPLAGVIDLAAENARLEKEMARVDTDIARIDAKLANGDFLRRAPEEVVEGEREKREEATARRSKIMEALERLRGAA